MFIRSFKAVEDAGDFISISHGKSRALRVILKGDGLGFSLSEARCGAGNASRLWYKNHWEANYVRAGKGSLVNTRTGQSWPLEPGILYCVGPNDPHSVVNTDDPLRIVSVFNPPIEGNETHDEDGAYPPTGIVPAGHAGMFVRTQDEARDAGNFMATEDGMVTSVRMLTASDKLGFSLNRVRLKASRQQDLWYKHHWEANLVLEGTLDVTDRATGQCHSLQAGDVYCVGPEDRHHLHARSDVELISIFNPPLTGQEKHDEDGSYPPTGRVPPGPG
jgi:L-ectoine synthase